VNHIVRRSRVGAGREGGLRLVVRGASMVSR
jgi:hypothetical protein